MGKNKKSFIDKKNSSTYHVLHRSQRDVGGDDNDGSSGTARTVLWPSPDNKQETNERVLNPESATTKNTAKGGSKNVMSEWREQALEGGLLDDYDYEQHMKPITGSGVYFDGMSGHVSQNGAHNDLRASELKKHTVDSDVKEVEREFESIALTPDLMDDDIAQALFGDFEEGNFEEILDDFCITAAEEPDDANKDGEFDFDAHIRELMERARKGNDDDGGIDANEHEWGKNDTQFFSKGKALRKKNKGAMGTVFEDEDYDDDDSFAYHDESDLADINNNSGGRSNKLSAEEERALCEKFEQTLVEYDSDDVGDLDEICEDIRGDRSLEGDAQLNAALDDFLIEKKDDIFMEGYTSKHLQQHPNRGKGGGSGFTALVGKSMINSQSLNIHNNVDTRSIKEKLNEADDILSNPIEAPPPEEILIDGKSYYSIKSRNPWDCESILTTYSNLDNNPVTIGSSNRRKKKNKKYKSDEPHDDYGEEEQYAQIQLSNKTGLPLNAFRNNNDADDDYIDDTYVSVNKGEARKKNESAAEKKARKEALKKEKEFKRMQKKMMKEAFRDEFMKRSGDVVTTDVGVGQSVFRYS